MSLNKGEIYSVDLVYDELLLGQGKYVFSAAVYKELDITKPEKAEFYDLLSRSFEFDVCGSVKDDLSLVTHPANWGDCEVNENIKNETMPELP